MEEVGGEGFVVMTAVVASSCAGDIIVAFCHGVLVWCSLDG